MGVLFSYFRLSLSQPVYFHLGGEEDMCLMGGAGPRLGRDEMGERREAEWSAGEGICISQVVAVVMVVP